MKPGPKPQRIVSEKWNENLAYAIGLLATDGCLSRSHHIDLTSNDQEQLRNYCKCLGINTRITDKFNGRGQKSYRIQFKNVYFYNFLVDIGLTPAKSRTIGRLKIPSKYFFDFLRGCFDGDGCSYSYWDKRWRSSFMFYISFTSASVNFISWIQKEIENRLGFFGHITRAGAKNYYYQLRYSKYSAVSLTREMYRKPDAVALSRKRLKINKSLAIIGEPQV